MLLQGSYRSWKTWKVIKFNIFNCRSWKVLKNFSYDNVTSVD